MSKFYFLIRKEEENAQINLVYASSVILKI